MADSNTATALSDLNEIAVSELKELLKADTRLQPKWKQVTIEILKDGLPNDLHELEKLISEEADNETKKAEG